MIENSNPKEEIKKLKLIIHNLNKKMKESSIQGMDSAIPKKARFNSQNADVLQEEAEYQKKISQSHGEEGGTSSSESTDSEESK